MRASQDERCPDGRVERGVGAREHQLQPLVGDGVVADAAGGCLLGRAEQLLPVALAYAAPPGLVRESPARRHQEPRFGHPGNARGGPVHECRGEGVREGVLRNGHVVRAAGEKGEQAPIAFARYPLRLDPGAGQAVIRHSGRTSTAPKAAPGQRAAQSIAASRSFASTM